MTAGKRPLALAILIGIAVPSVAEDDMLTRRLRPRPWEQTYFQHKGAEAADHASELLDLTFDTASFIADKYWLFRAEQAVLDRRGVMAGALSDGSRVAVFAVNRSVLDTEGQSLVIDTLPPVFLGVGSYWQEVVYEAIAGDYGDPDVAHMGSGSAPRVHLSGGSTLEEPGMQEAYFISMRRAADGEWVVQQHFLIESDIVRSAWQFSKTRQDLLAGKGPAIVQPDQFEIARIRREFELRKVELAERHASQLAKEAAERSRVRSERSGRRSAMNWPGRDDRSQPSGAAESGGEVVHLPAPELPPPPIRIEGGERLPDRIQTPPPEIRQQLN